ncbi:MAG: hypothetical protein ACR2O4_16500 [Hyphomicrobiaceae bacterium]
MNELLLFFGFAAVLAGVLANIGIWSPHRLWVKLIAVGVLALFLPLSYWAFSELLSRPKPAGIEWAQRAVPEAVVLGSSMIEDKAIYLWLRFAGQGEPRAYVLPWSKKLARQLHKAQQQGAANGRKVMMRKPFGSDLDRMERVFYSEPHSSPPPKLVSTKQGPLIFQGTGQSTNSSN